VFMPISKDISACSIGSIAAGIKLVTGNGANVGQLAYVTTALAGLLKKQVENTVPTKTKAKSFFNIINPLKTA
jgi:hypothetical protein